MKKIVVLILLVAVVVAGAPFILGFEIESRYRGLLAQFEEAGYELTAHDYQRGVFNSEAVSDLEIPMMTAEGQNEPLKFKLISHIMHGPYSPDAGWFGQLAQFKTDIHYQDKPIFPEQMNANMQTTLMFNGDGQTSFDMPAFLEPMQLDDGVLLTFSGVNGVFNFNVVSGHFDSRFDSAGFSVNSPGQGQITLKDIQLQSVADRWLEDLMLGGGFARVGMLSFNDQTDGFAMNMQGLEVGADTSAGEKTIDMTINYAVDAIELPGEKLGRSEIELQFSSLDAKAIASIQQALKVFQKNDGLTADQKMTALMGSLMAASPSLLQHDPKFAITKMNIATPEGLLKAAFSLGTKGMTIADINMLPLAMAKILADINLQVPENVVIDGMFEYFRPQLALQLQAQSQDDAEITAETIDDATHEFVKLQLESVIEQKLVERQGDMLSVSASMKDGSISVNGKPMALPGM